MSTEESITSEAEDISIAEKKMTQTFDKKQKIRFRQIHDIIFLGKYFNRRDSRKKRKNKIMNKYVSTVRKEKSGNEESHFIFIKEIKQNKEDF